MNNPMVSRVIAVIVRALVEGLAVAVAAIFIAKRDLPMKEVFGLAITAAVVFVVLDSKFLSPAYGSAARTGAGFGLGANLVGFPMRA
jgi:hypothetical protein